MERAGCYAIAYLLVWGCGLAVAEPGAMLLQYESALKTLPAQQGWTCTSRCLRTRCPANAQPPIIPGYAGECHFQGSNGNDCTQGRGCGPDAAGAAAEHFNAPSEPVGVTGACTYTEWMAFDDGEDYLDLPFPAPLPRRNLTFAHTYWGPHAHPAFGAPGFINASGYPALRIVTGGGVPGSDTLPASGSSARNTGRVHVSRAYALPSGTQAVTLVAKLACGNRHKEAELVRLSGFGRCIALGVDGEEGSPTLGRLGWGNNKGFEQGMFSDHQVLVALARDGLWGPHAGEFFVIRIILHSDGAVQAWFNDKSAGVWSGTAGAGSGRTVDINPDEQAGTMWVDYVRLYEGAVPPTPPLCGDPAFDINHDGRVDHADRSNGLDGFLDCATGPAVPPGLLETLPARCRCHDSNGDGAIDMIDFAAFQRCLTLSDAPAHPTCGD